MRYYEFKNAAECDAAYKMLFEKILQALKIKIVCNGNKIELSADPDKELSFDDAIRRSKLLCYLESEIVKFKNNKTEV